MATVGNAGSGELSRTGPDPSPEQCLDGARRGLANARRLYLASTLLRRRGFSREAVLLVATSVEEATRAGMLHRAWIFRESPEASAKALAAWRRMGEGRKAHQRKHAMAPFTGSTTAAVAMLFALVADALTRDSSERVSDKLMDTLLGANVPQPTGWYGRLWEERQRVYVAWKNGAWSEDIDAGAFYDEGRSLVIALLHNLRGDVGADGGEDSQDRPGAPILTPA